MDFYAQLGANLRRLRLTRGWSAEHIADQMGITVDAVFKYERGVRKMPAHMIVQAACILGCSIMSIYDGLDPRMPVAGKELNMLSPECSAMLVWLATEWDGDVEALLTIATQLSTFPPEERREIYMEIEIASDRLLADGVISRDRFPAGMDAMLQKLGGLYQEEQL